MTRDDILRKAEKIMDKQEQDRRFYWACNKANICPKCGEKFRLKNDVIKCPKCGFRGGVYNG